MSRVRHVGWVAASEHCSDLLFAPPEMLRPQIPCPAISAWLTRTFLLRAPYDVDLRFVDDGQGPRLAWGEDGPQNDVYESFALVAPSLWPSPATPIVLWDLRHVFVADGPVVLDTCAPFMHADAKQWPGAMLPQRFRLDRETRAVNWAFLWQDPAVPLRIRRGEPIQYARFNGDSAQATIRLQPVPYSAAIADALAGRTAAVALPQPD